MSTQHFKMEFTGLWLHYYNAFDRSVPDRVSGTRRSYVCSVRINLARWHLLPLISRRTIRLWSTSSALLGPWRSTNFTWIARAASIEGGRCQAGCTAGQPGGTGGVAQPWSAHERAGLLHR